MNRKTVEAFVLNHSPHLNAYFAYSKEVPQDLIIDSNSAVPFGENILGKWIEAEVRDVNSVRQRVKIIEDLFDTRILNNIAQIKVEAYYDGRYENKFSVFRNSYFGFIFDTMNLVDHIDRNTVYQFWISRLTDRRLNSRWKVAANPTNQSSLRTVEAIVHSNHFARNQYIAWTRTETCKLFIDYTMCTSNQDMLGRWIEMTIDSKNAVQKTVEVIPDVFPTRVKAGFTEIHVDFEAGDEVGMFYNQYFGNIYDRDQIVTLVEKDAWYEGWIVHSFVKGIDSRWRLSKLQVIDGPFINRREKHSDNAHTENRRNSWNDKDDSRSNCLRRDSRDFDDLKYWESTSSNNSELTYRNHTRHNYDYDNSMDNRGPETKSMHRNIDDSHPERIRSQAEFNQSDRYHPNNQDTTYDNSRKQLPPSNPSSSGTNSKNRLEIENDYINRVQSPTEVKNSCKHTYPHSSNIPQELNKSRKIDYTDTKVVDIRHESVSSSTKSEKSAKSQRTLEEKTLLKMKTDLADMSRLVQSLTKDSSVSDNMKLVNLEDFEELMKLTTL